MRQPASHLPLRVRGPVVRGAGLLDGQQRDHTSDAYVVKTYRRVAVTFQYVWGIHVALAARMTGSGWLAFVDESEPDTRVDPGTYLLAAAIVERDHVDRVAEKLRSQLLPGQRKLHWRDESTLRRTQLSAVVGELDMLHLVVVRTGGRDGERSERRRRLCLQRLLSELDATGVHQVVLEARQVKQNQADRDLLDALRAAKQVERTLRMEHVPGPENSVLAAADIVCGAVAADRQGEPTHLIPLKRQLTVLTLDDARGS